MEPETSNSGYLDPAWGKQYLDRITASHRKPPCKDSILGIVLTVLGRYLPDSHMLMKPPQEEPLDKSGPPTKARAPGQDSEPGWLPDPPGPEAKCTMERPSTGFTAWMPVYNI